MSEKLLTIIMATNRVHNISGFLYNIQETCEDPSCLEVLIKIDEGDDMLRDLLDHAIEMYPFTIRYLQTPKLDGYYTLHKGYQQLFEISDPQSYFVFLTNDELRFATKGWDRVLQRYVGTFPDDVFRLKLSVHKYFSYYSYHECGPCPENYPIFTRRWMELVEGVGDCWGPDGWHQFIDYHLGAIHMPGIFRSVPVDDILLTGEAAGLELTKEQSFKRTYRIYQEWWRMYSVEKQREFRRLATKLYVYIKAHEQGYQKMGFTLCENQKSKFFDVFIPGVKQPVYASSYHLSGLTIRLHNFALLLRCLQGRWGDPLTVWTYIRSSAEPSLFPLNYLNRLANFLAVCAAIIISPFTPYFASLHGPIGLRLRIKATQHRNFMHIFPYFFKDWMKAYDKWMALEQRRRQILGAQLLAILRKNAADTREVYRFAAQPDSGADAKKIASQR
jgi:hypothetical protein